MTPLIMPSKDIQRLLYYNERKVKANEARCIFAGNFVQDVQHLDLSAKTTIFRYQMALNQRVEWRALHIVLEFALAEQLSDGRMAEIAIRYMEGIGFGRQPYLVYRHVDAAFPHCHVVTTNIRWDGSQVDSYKLGPRRSVTTRRSIEEHFGLLTGRSSGQALAGRNPAEKVQYGKAPATQAIGESLDFILHAYHYRSLDELNAILRLYNLRAVGGRPGSLLHTHRGLLYQILDDNGRGKGAPVSAAAIYFKPVLAWLQKRFDGSQTLDASALGRVRFALDSILRDKPVTGSQFADALRRRQLAAAPVFDEHGQLSHLLFVDLAAKAVYSPADLGVDYGYAVIKSRLEFDPFPAPAKRRGQNLRFRQSAIGASTSLDPGMPVKPTIPTRPVSLQLKPKGRSRRV